MGKNARLWVLASVAVISVLLYYCQCAGAG